MSEGKESRPQACVRRGRNVTNQQSATTRRWGGAGGVAGFNEEEGRKLKGKQTKSGMRRRKVGGAPRLLLKDLPKSDGEETKGI